MCFTWGTAPTAGGVAMFTWWYRHCATMACACSLAFARLVVVAGALTVVAMHCVIWLMGCRNHQAQE
ncbi:hypothetical protein E2562_023457 [Oryza meyeriana var. granulata]|uniref:Uncharacterized protein n=1 Tax=Oryza meyeriana var. granulata TaxID=110450 RepID=A0A6G1FBP5_9ORYZ|nr:hypothetical protein E2562_023457 [Oryza meyeriana var. granulata]